MTAIDIIRSNSVDLVNHVIILGFTDFFFLKIHVCQARSGRVRVLFPYVASGSLGAISGSQRQPILHNDQTLWRRGEICQTASGASAAQQRR